jgi:LPS export ABC transporter protein LptC
VLKSNIDIKRYSRSIATLIVVAVLFLSCQKNNLEQIQAFIHPPGAPEVVAEGLIILHSDSAIIRFTLECSRLLVYQDEEEPFNEFPDGFKIIQYDRNKNITSSIEARYGKYYPKKELWEAKQNVEVVTEKGDSLKTELLYWDQKKEMIYTDQFITIIQPNKNITGTGLESDLQMERWKIIKPRGPITIEVEQ